MKRNCDLYRDRLPDAAEGRADADTRAHLAECASCGEVVAELEKVLLLASLQRFDPPEEVVRRAVAIMPERSRVWARLISSSLSSAGARRASSDFQLLVGDDEVRVRLMVNRSGKGWSVAGKLPSAEWSAAFGGSELKVDEQGRFSFDVQDLEQGGLVLGKGGLEMHVPPLSQLMEDGRNGRN